MLRHFSSKVFLIVLGYINFLIVYTKDFVAFNTASVFLWAVLWKLVVYSLLSSF